MTDLVQQARAALEGVTPGPWAYNSRREVGPLHEGDDQAWGMICDPVAECNFSDDYLGNARFIAASRDLVPAMADEIERLRAALRKAEVLIDGAVFTLNAQATPLKKRWADWRHDARALLEKFAEITAGKP